MIPRVTVRLPGVELHSTHSAPFMVSNIEGLADSTDPVLVSDQRERGHGVYGQSEVWQAARRITIEGHYAGADRFAAGDVLKRLTSQHFEAEFVLPSGTFRCEVVLASRVHWRPVGVDGADFEFTLEADDPRLYGPMVTASTGVPTPGVGVADPILDPFQEGEEGNAGRVRLMNSGTAPSEPLTRVYGGVSEGFELLCIESSRVVTVTRPIPDGSFVLVDHARGEVWLDGVSLLPSTYIPSSEWFEVGPGEACTIQWRPLGAVTGTPYMSVEFAEASW